MEKMKNTKGKSANTYNLVWVNGAHNIAVLLLHVIITCSKLDNIQIWQFEK